LVAAARADLARYGGFRNTLLFDQRIGNTYVFTQPDLNELFGQVDSFKLVPRPKSNDRFGSSLIGDRAGFGFGSG
jgi:hypothetical protein